MNQQQLVKKAQILAVITIGYNIIEGLVSVIFGINDGTLALFGFGIDSLVEVVSGIGILHMVVRMKATGPWSDLNKDRFERNALLITGMAFYILATGLILGAVIMIIARKKPETTLAGVIISVVSIITMYALMRIKMITGRQLNSDAIVADAQCTRTCFYLSIILLVSSACYEFFAIPWFDIAGSFGVAWFAIREGREAFEKANIKTHKRGVCNNQG
jgi:divalent metal cation (Fe/Co/Zn/Cd) transporter